MNMPARQTCSTATISLVFGILSYFVLPFIGAVIAIICGHMARSEIRRSANTLDGDGLAVAGLILGYVHLVLLVLVIAMLLLVFGGMAAFLAFAAHHHT